jgi:hypothetical protein
MYQQNIWFIYLISENGFQHVDGSKTSFITSQSSLKQIKICLVFLLGLPL